MFAEAATLAATDETRDIHLGTGLGEGEVGGAQTDLGVGSEHLAGKTEQYLLQVGERHVLVDVETLHLMEEAVGTSRDGLVAINAAWADDTDGSGEFSVLGVHLFHHTGLNTRGVRAQQDVLRHIVGMLAHEECVLHVAGWMISGEVHLGEDMEVVLNLRTVSQHEAHAAEDVDDLVGDDGQWMACAKGNGVGRACQIDGIVASLLSLAGFTQLVDAFCIALLQLVDFHANLFLLFGRHRTEVVHQFGYLALLAQVFQAQLFYLFGVLCLQRVHQLKEFIDFLEYHCFTFLLFYLILYCGCKGTK